MSNLEHAPQEILRMNNEDGVKLSENEFVTKWLLTLREYMAGGEVEISIWLNTMRISVFSEVTILDAAGMELYKVPSIFIKQDRVLPKSISAEMGDIMYRAEGLNRTIPGKGDSFINNAITSHILNNNDLPEYQKRWDAIFTRYDLEPVFNTATTSLSMNPDEGFDDYDEL